MPRSWGGMEMGSLLRTIDRGAGRLASFMSLLACAAAAGLTLFILLSSFMRYFLGKPFYFTEDVVSMLFLASSFLSIPITAHQRSYIRISMLTDRLPPVGRHVAAIFGSLVFLVFVLWFAWDAWQITALSYEISARTETAEIPVVPWMALMPLSMGLVGILCVVQILELVRVLCGYPSSGPPTGETIG
ncbi:MAG: TRAP transporter small permease [Alphaproteobacteria bacterium]|nr:TRAP transporter small permease [Alphaproteobacteria bacterium]